MRQRARVAAVVVAGVVASNGGCVPPVSTGPARLGRDMFVFAEGVCPELSIHAAGDRRFVAYGDTGYDLHGWMPGDRVAAAQALVEVAEGAAHVNPALSAGLPTDARGYARGAIEIGGDAKSGLWLRLTTSHYARGGTGALFEREAEGFVFSSSGWARNADAVALPVGARDLPEVPADACGELTLVPLAWQATTDGGLVIAGRCDDPSPVNPEDPTLMVLHGAAGARAWQVARVPETESLNGIVNVEMAARGDDDIFLVAYEPFRDLAARESFVAHYDGKSWQALDWPIVGGTMSVAVAPAGGVYFATSNKLVERRPDGVVKEVALPPLAFAEVSAADRHVHTVRVHGDEVWAGASYRVNVPAEGGRLDSVWASALYSNVKPRGVYYCDAREDASQAFYEVPP